MSKLRSSQACCLLLALRIVSGCHVYDAQLTEAPDIPDASTCEPADSEACNGADDDCDGVVDEAEATQTDCARRILHAETGCYSGLCVKFECFAGFYNCDGVPDNGCESACACEEAPCSDDAGTTDREAR